MDCCRKASLERQFNNFIKLGKTPGQLDCLNAIRKEKALSGFTWRNVKFAVKNIIPLVWEIAENEIPGGRNVKFLCVIIMLP